MPLTGKLFFPLLGDDDARIYQARWIQGSLQSGHQVTFHRAAVLIGKPDLGASEAVLCRKGAIHPGGERRQGLADFGFPPCKIGCPLICSVARLS